MILSARKIAALLESQTPKNDPLVIAPEPDLEELRKQGQASIDLRLGCWFAVLKQPRAPILDIGESGSGASDATDQVENILIGRLRAANVQADESIALNDALNHLRKRTQIKLNEASLIKMHYVRFGDKFILHPRSFVLGGTLEWVRLPRNIAGYVTSRSSWGRRGLIIATATGVHPQFTGCLTLELFNSGEVPIALYPGMAVCQFFLHNILSPSRLALGGAMAGRRKPFLGSIKLDPIAKAIAQLN